METQTAKGLGGEKSSWDKLFQVISVEKRLMKVYTLVVFIVLVNSVNAVS